MWIHSPLARGKKKYSTEIRPPSHYPWGEKSALRVYTFSEEMPNGSDIVAIFESVFISLNPLKTE